LDADELFMQTLIMNKANRNILIKIGLVAAVVLAIGLFFVFDLDRYLTLSYLKQTREQFQAVYADHTLLVLGSFFLIYVSATALSLPGAAVLTLAAGALFGFWTALVLVSFASTIGATLAFLFARFLLRDWVQQRLGERLSQDQQGSGAGRLLLPVHPAAHSRLSLLADQSDHGPDPDQDLDLLLGLPGGHASGHGRLRECRQAARGDRHAGPDPLLEIILSFALLGIFPLAAKKLLVLYRRKTGKPEKPIHEGS
jgi:hypothetical protein